MNPITLKTPSDLYKIAPDLATLAERLENSVTKTNAENAEREAIKKANKNTPGFRASSYSKRKPDQFRIIEIQKIGQTNWEKIPSEFKSGRPDFESDITSVAARNPQAIKISVGKVNGMMETYTIYLLEKPVEQIPKQIELGNPQENEKVNQLEKNFIELSKANGSEQSKELLSLNFAKQLSDFKHESAINELKRDHERKVEKLQWEHKEELQKKDQQLEKQLETVSELRDEIEELEEELNVADETLSGTADLINAKKEPPAFAELAIGILSGVAKKLAIENPSYLSAVTNKSPEEIKKMLVADAETFETKQIETTKETNDASFEEVTSNNEYEKYDPVHAKQLKDLHAFAKSLNPDNFLKFYNICAFCCLPDGSIHSENADMLLDLITPKQ